MQTGLLRFLCIVLFGLSTQLLFAQILLEKKSANKTCSRESQTQFSSNSIDGIDIVAEVLVNIADSSKNLSESVQTRAYRQVKIFKIKLNSNAKALLTEQAQKIRQARLDSYEYSSKPSANKIDLGMNSVPVLEQGIYGTCTVFVVTAALDALMNAGDYISQQCLLELGVALQNPQVTSGWNGAWGAVILNRIENYGVVLQQHCPHRYADPNASLSSTEYLNLSNRLWSRSFRKNKLSAKNIDTIKTALDKGHRVLISTIFHKDYINGDSIYGYRYGLWSLPENLNKFIREIQNGASTAHSTLVIGYNDQTGLLKIRNSWGAKAGVKGDYYMTYEYYKLMNIDAIEIY